MRKQDHEHFMKKALAQAKKALALGEVPVGALVVDEEGVILGRGYNKMEAVGCQTGHAEVIAIQKACKKRGDWRLDDCSLYVTLEPCLMCFGLAQLSRIKEIIFATESPLFGFGFKKSQSLPFLKKDLLLHEGILKEEAVNLLQTFFKTIRTKKKGQL